MAYEAHCGYRPVFKVWETRDHDEATELQRKKPKTTTAAGVQAVQGGKGGKGKGYGAGSGAYGKGKGGPGGGFYGGKSGGGKGKGGGKGGQQFQQFAPPPAPAHATYAQPQQ